MDDDDFHVSINIEFNGYSISVDGPRSMRYGGFEADECYDIVRGLAENAIDKMKRVAV